jgi:hypothetical protein
MAFKTMMTDSIEQCDSCNLSITPDNPGITFILDSLPSCIIWIHVSCIIKAIDKHRKEAGDHGE